MEKRDSREDWRAFRAEEIPTKAATPELDAFLARLERSGGASPRVLDVGCGTGGISRRLAASGLAVVGIDVNAEALRAARAAAAKDGRPADFHERDAADPAGFRLAEAPFAAVVCQLLISIVGDRPRRERLIANLFGALAPGGRLYLSASGVSDDINPAYRELYAADLPLTGERHTYYSRDGGGRVLYETHHFTEAELHALLEDAGLAEVSVTRRRETSTRRKGEAAWFLYATALREPRQ